MRIHAGLLVLVLVAGCQNSPPTPQEETGGGATAQGPGPIEKAGLHNVFRITSNLYSGSVPEGEEGFRSLKELGIKTVISVDGARPEVAVAHEYGMRYVHIPFGYDGIPRQQVLRLVKAVRDLPGPVYVHCHHGKHRGPTAAAAIHLCSDEKCSVEQAVTEMRRAGADPHYTGLYAVPPTLVRPSAEELDRVPNDFPEVAEVSNLAQHMVEIDARWENLKAIRVAGWKTPPGHADLNPPHEALQVVEHFREAARLEQTQKRPEEFRQGLASAEKNAQELENALRRREGDEAEQAFVKAGKSCTQCHAKYRDVAQGR